MEIHSGLFSSFNNIRNLLSHVCVADDHGSLVIFAIMEYMTPTRHAKK